VDESSEYPIRIRKNEDPGANSLSSCSIAFAPPAVHKENRMMLRLAIALLAIALIVAGFVGVGGLEDLPSEAGKVLLLVFVIFGVRYLLGRPLRGRACH
jgi:uncharacterized membrane protein YtjA (UPF0391 family)